jgi:hypothetical protein
MREIRYGIVIVVVGTIIYLIRAWRSGEWPFSGGAVGERSVLVD